MAHPADHPGPLAFVDDLEAPALAAADLHHLQRVLRLRAGEPLTLGDGRGGWRPARFAAEPEPSGPIEHVAPRPVALTVAFALVKGDKPELAVQKLTELGIDRIIPFRAERSVVRWDDAKAPKAIQRLRQVARSAAAQCHRPWIPDVSEVADLAGLLATGDAGLVAADRGGVDLSDAHSTVLVGPEGGWAVGELPASLARVALGPHVLRAETAAIVAGALLVDRHRTGG